MTTDFIRSVICYYSETRPDVLKVWLYGSRAENRQREDSDIDLFFELDPVFQKSGWSVLVDWDNDKKRILTDLSGKFLVEVHPVPAYPSLETWGVREKAQTGILIYERAG